MVFGSTLTTVHFILVAVVCSPFHGTGFSLRFSKIFNFYVQNYNLGFSFV